MHSFHLNPTHEHVILKMWYKYIENGVGRANDSCVLLQLSRQLQ